MRVSTALVSMSGRYVAGLTSRSDDCVRSESIRLYTIKAEYDDRWSSKMKESCSWASRPLGSGRSH